jgi:hypothetical protein
MGGKAAIISSASCKKHIYSLRNAGAHQEASSSRACLRLVAVIPIPPSMRATSPRLVVEHVDVGHRLAAGGRNLNRVRPHLNMANASFDRL